MYKRVVKRGERKGKLDQEMEIDNPTGGLYMFLLCTRWSDQKFVTTSVGFFGVPDQTSRRASTSEPLQCFATEEIEIRRTLSVHTRRMSVFS